MRVLVIAPHADDETLGVGATIAKRVDAGHHVTVALLTGHGGNPHPLYPASDFDITRGELRSAMAILGAQELLFRELPVVLVGDLPMWEVNRVVKDVIDSVMPDELYVPFPFDMHRDHRELFHAASVAWRPVSDVGRGIKRILAYEVLSETHWNAPYLEPGFLPTVFEDVTETLDRKIDALREFRSQLRQFPDIRSIEAIRALATLRGGQIGVRAAEAFVQIRSIS
jgi:LmbE family N-acetylglucosaminyl deacetylase